MQKNKILSLAIATATVVTGLVWVTTATNSPEVLDNWDLKVCGTEYISDSNGSGWCITIQGKNVWATTTWAWPDAPSTSYWNYYQRWDNTPRTEANWLTNYSPSDNAWWWWSDNNGLVYPVTNGSERRWPCDAWYHVPSQWEWYALMDMWAGSSVNWFINSNLSQFYTAFQIPFVGARGRDDGFLRGRGSDAYLWSSSPSVGEESARYFFMMEYYASAGDYFYRTSGLPVRCFEDPVKLISTITENTTTTIWWNAPVTWLPTTMTVAQNTISTVEWKEVLWEVNVDFWSNETAIFSHPVEINIPVSDHEQVIVKVKHGWESEYGFAWLTRNRNASCSKWQPTSNQYNWETINVVDWYATIYTCSASSFIALGLDNWWDSEIVVNIWQFNNWQNTCTWQDFIFADIVASPTTITRNLVKTFQCAFGEMWQKAVTLQLQWDLTDWSGNVISSWNVKIKNSAWVWTPAWVKWNAVSTDSYTSLSNTITLFNKASNIIWIAEWTWVDIQIEIPWWTPDGTYNGVLVLSY